MKNILLLIIAAVIYTTGTAQQYLSNLIVQAQPPAQLSEWGNRREVLTLIVSAPGAIAGPFKIKTEIRLTDGTVIATSDLAKTPVFTPNSGGGQTILTANDVMPLEYMMFTGKYKTSLQRTGKLPADNYTICTQPVHPVDYRVLGEIQCKNFYLASTQLPILMKPYNEEVLDAKKAQTAIIFRWTPVLPRQTAPVTYRIQVFEVLPTQSPVQALRSNQPLLDKEIMAATQFIWQPQLSFMPYDNETTKMPTFVWTIQSLDKDHNPVTQTDGSGEGRSEPIIFFVNPDKNNKTKKEN
ncbi:MAG: hypothetical protein WAR78_13095 [Ferruginibacter sp.]